MFNRLVLFVLLLLQAPLEGRLYSLTYTEYGGGMGEARRQYVCLCALCHPGFLSFWVVPLKLGDVKSYCL